MPAEAPSEHEAKFQLSPDLLPQLSPPTLALDGYTVYSLGQLTHIDTYMDTPSFDLLRHGLSLRIRRKGELFEVGIKSIEAKQRGAVLERMDIAIALPVESDPFDPTQWPKDVEGALLPVSVNLDTMRPVVIVRQQRQKSHISAANSKKVIAEWSLDEVWITTPANATSFQSHHGSHFHELEIEQISSVAESGDEFADVSASEPENSTSSAEQDSERAFTDLVLQVQERFNLLPIYTSKVVRGFESVIAQAHENNDLIGATMELEAALRLLLHQQLLQMLLNENGVRTSKKSKYVHEMRVAIRRARAAMQLCESAFSAKELAPHQKGLKRLGSALGAVRDLDVALANLRDFKRSQSQSHHKAIKRLRAELKSQRAEARADLMKLLDSKTHRKFVKTFAEFCITPRGLDQSLQADDFEIVPSQVRHTLPSMLLRAFESVRAYELLFAGDDLPPLESIHSLRIQSKYMRYLLEFSQHFLGKEGESLLIQLRDFQEKLGLLNDAHVEEQRLVQWAEKMTDDATLIDAISTRLIETQSRIGELAASVPARLDILIRPSTRKKLATALARI